MCVDFAIGKNIWWYFLWSFPDLRQKTWALKLWNPSLRLRDTWDSYLVLISWSERERERVKTIWVAIFLRMHPRLRHQSPHIWTNLTFQSISSLCISFISTHSQFSYFSFLVFFFFLLHSEVYCLLFPPITLRGKFPVWSSKLNEW